VNAGTISMGLVLTGPRVRWRHLNEQTGQPAVDCEGAVVATEMSGKEFVFLILRSDGLFVTATAADVELVDEFPAPLASEAEVAAAGIPPVVALPDGGADALVNLAVGIRALGLADEKTDADPVAFALNLLTEALNDLRTMQEQLDAAGGGDERLNQLLAERKTLQEQVKKLSDEVAELRAKKTKKPKAAAAEKAGDADKPDKAEG
jgi:hypothetical protein